MITNTVFLPQEPELLVDPNRERDELTLENIFFFFKGEEKKTLFFSL